MYISLCNVFFTTHRRAIMKKIFSLMLLMTAFISANVLIEDFEANDRHDLLDPSDVWFIFSDSADVGCQSQMKGYPCSKFNTFFMDFTFDDWSFEPRHFAYEAEVPETTYVVIPADTSVTDTTIQDPTITDTTVTDTTVIDTSVTDTSITDTSITDTIVTDTSLTDSTVDDSSVVPEPEPPKVDTIIKTKIVMRDTLLYFPLRSESPFNSADKKSAGPKSSTLVANDTYVGGFYYEFGESYLVYETYYNKQYDDYDYAPQYWFVPYVAMGLKTKGNGVTYDLKKCTGISYKFRGPAHIFRADLSTVTDNNYHFTKVNASKVIEDVYGANQGWSTATIKWTQLAQESGWGTKRTFNAAKINQLVWMVKGGNQDNVYGNDFNATFLPDKAILGISPDIGELAIDDVTCITDGNEIPVGATSSSSKGSDVVVPQDNNLISDIQINSNGISFFTQATSRIYIFDHLGRFLNISMDLPTGANFISFEKMPQGMFIAQIRSKGHTKTLKFYKR